MFVKVVFGLGVVGCSGRVLQRSCRGRVEVVWRSCRGRVDSVLWPEVL